jgi:predicted amino acid racemase
VNGLTPLTDVNIIGSSSDHIILEITKSIINVGDKIRFKLNYSALLSAMTSPFVKKVIINNI